MDWSRTAKIFASGTFLHSPDSRIPNSRIPNSKFQNSRFQMFQFQNSRFKFQNSRFQNFKFQNSRIPDSRFQIPDSGFGSFEKPTGSLHSGPGRVGTICDSGWLKIGWYQYFGPGVPQPTIRYRRWYRLDAIETRFGIPSLEPLELWNLERGSGILESRTLEFGIVESGILGIWIPNSHSKRSKIQNPDSEIEPDRELVYTSTIVVAGLIFNPKSKFQNPKSIMVGYFSLVLHAHLPFVRHPEYPNSLKRTGCSRRSPRSIFR
ncbi:MAG: hypothetical protein IPJ30_23605 [Acidobacteria bacterium]|nr:hypothetical protein [Acidobacteriota bacterium]